MCVEASKSKTLQKGAPPGLDTLVIDGTYGETWDYVAFPEKDRVVMET